MIQGTASRQWYFGEEDGQLPCQQFASSLETQLEGVIEAPMISTLVQLLCTGG
jgi:hypothetical protein